MNPDTPAFPHNGTCDRRREFFPVSYTGLTIRAEFAKAAMQGILAAAKSEIPPTILATASVAYADGMIAELNKSTQP